MKNNIRIIEPLAFYGLTRILHLFLSNNKLTEILPDSFLGLSELIQLDLSFNNITRFASSAFNGLENLLELGFYDLPDHLEFGDLWYDGLKRIKKISLSLENVQTIDPAVWENIIQIKYVYTKNQNDYYDSINLITNERVDTLNEYDCGLTTFFITKSLNFNLQNDQDFNSFVSNCYNLDLLQES